MFYIVYVFWSRGSTAATINGRNEAAPLHLAKKNILVLFLLAFACPPYSPAQESVPYATKVRAGEDVEVSLYTPTMFRVRVSHLSRDKFPAEYEIPFVIGHIQNWSPVMFDRWQDKDSDWIRTSGMRIGISRRDGSWSVWTADGSRKIYPSNGPTYGIFRDGYTEFDSAAALDQPTDYSRFSHWFYNPKTGRYVDTYLAEDAILDKFFIYGPDYYRLFAQLNELVGPEPLLPKKAYGFFQTQHLGCKGSQSQLMDVAERLRRDHIPTDTLIIDYEWGDGCPGGDEDDKYWGQLQWSKSYQSPLSPKEMIAKLKNMHFDVMLIHHSVPDLPHRQENVQRDPKRYWVARTNDEQFWFGKLKDELELGVRGIWQDTRKNDLTDSAIWSWLQNYYGSSKRVLFMGNRNMVEVDPWSPERDVSRPSNSLLGSRRYPFRWTGDAHTTWSELRWHIKAMTDSYGEMSGISYLTADGFAANWKQQARWNQFLAFTPVSRSHTLKPWDIPLTVESLKSIMQFGDKSQPTPLGAPPQDSTENQTLARKKFPDASTAEESVRKNLALRYRLLPYIYSTAFEHYRTGFPMGRPMVLAFPDDPNCKFDRWAYQYMFGESLLVAPVWADLNTMEIYLPSGSDWIDHWDKRVYHGGQILTYDTTDVTKLPLFVRAGSIIPMGKQREWIDPEDQNSPITLDIYPSDKLSSFQLYDDDGVSTLYQVGQFAITTLQTQREPNGNVTVTIGPRVGRYAGESKNRQYRLDVNELAQAPSRVLRDGKAIPRKPSLAALKTETEGWAYDPERHVAEAIFMTNTDKRSTAEFEVSPN